MQFRSLSVALGCSGRDGVCPRGSGQLLRTTVLKIWLPGAFLKGQVPVACDTASDGASCSEERCAVNYSPRVTADVWACVFLLLEGGTNRESRKGEVTWQQGFNCPGEHPPDHLKYGCQIGFGAAVE